MSRRVRSCSAPRARALHRAAFGRCALPICVALALSGAVGLPSRVGASPQQGVDTPGDPHADGVVSEAARRRVRGGRPDGASIHLAWAPGARDPDADERAALDSFEKSAFGGAQARATIVDAPPEAWMRQLATPDVPVRWNSRTVEYLRHFRDDQSGQRMMRAWLRRAGRYEARMRRMLAEASVPEDLVMVALAESGFNPRVRSEVGAAGPWQFMEGTGSVYGLSSSYWIDERYDVDKSTRAAALYLKDLRVRFGSWELALAAFNAGYGLVMTAIERHNTNNYWALCEIESGLPFATTNYAPKIIAAAIVGRNREAFGVDGTVVTPLPAASWAEVKVPQSTSLKKLAKAIGADETLVLEYNAKLVRERTPPKVDEFVVRIPRDRVEAFNAATNELQQSWRAESTYELRQGDDLDLLARTFGTTVAALRELNGVDDGAELKPGITLVVPASPDPDLTPEPLESPDTVLAAVPALTPPSGHRLVFFVATRASTPREVAKAFDVTWNAIVEWNDLDPQARLQPSQVLQLVVPLDFDPDRRGVLAYEMSDVEYVERGSQAHLEAGLRRRGKTRRGYSVRKGDDLAKIGRRFDLTVGDLARINGFGRAHPLEPGDVVVVYVPEDKTSGTQAAPPVRPAIAQRRSAGPPAVKTQPVPARTPPARPRTRPSTANTSRVPGAGAAK